MAIRMKEWGMLATPGQPVNVRTQGLYGWERVGRSVGEGLADVLAGGWALSGLSQKVNSAGELAAFSDQLRSMSAEVREELQDAEVADWDYAWNTSMTPRINEAVQGLSAASREGALALAQAYSAQSSIEARRDREMQRVSTARGRWAQQVDGAVAAGQEEQALRWLEAGRGVFVPEGQMPERQNEVRSRACYSRLEARLQAAPMAALSEIASAEKDGTLPLREEEKRRLQGACTRTRASLRRELAASFSEQLRAGEEPEPAALSLAAGAGLLPAGAADAAAQGADDARRSPSATTRSSWRHWLDSRAEGEEAEQEARLAIATAPLPLAERRALLLRMEQGAKVPAADRRTLSNRLLQLYHSGALGCPGDEAAQRALLALQDEGASLLAEQGAEAVVGWLKSRQAGADNWVCFEPEEAPRKP